MAVNFVNQLPRDRFEPFLCSTRRGGLLAGEVLDDVGRLELGRTRRIHDLAALHRLARFLREQSIDIVHAHGTSLFIAAAACQLVPRTRLVWHDHLGATTDTRQRKRLLYRLAAARTDHIITVSKLLETWAEAELGLPPDHVTTIPNFVLPADGAAGRRDLADLAELPGVAGRRIACVANLRRQKDHFTLLGAMAQLIDDLPGAHALLLGAAVDASLERSITEQIQTLGLDGNVTLLGARPDVAAVLARCDVGVLSSRSEGFPLALLEYGMAGLPVVATDVGECGEILDRGAAGALVPPGDTGALAGALHQLLTDPASAAHLGDQLKRRVEDRYGAEAVLARVEAIYGSVLGGEP